MYDEGLRSFIKLLNDFLVGLTELVEAIFISIVLKPM